LLEFEPLPLQFCLPGACGTYHRLLPLNLKCRNVSTLSQRLDPLQERLRAFNFLSLQCNLFADLVQLSSYERFASNQRLSLMPGDRILGNEIGPVAPLLFRKLLIN